jgi:hypothetical protein
MPPRLNGLHRYLSLKRVLLIQLQFRGKLMIGVSGNAPLKNIDTGRKIDELFCSVSRGRFKALYFATQ